MALPPGWLSKRYASGAAPLEDPMPDEKENTWKEYFYTSTSGSGYVYADSYDKDGTTVSFKRNGRVVLVVENVVTVSEDS